MFKLFGFCRAWVLVLLSVLPLLGCGGGDAAPPADAHVNVGDPVEGIQPGVMAISASARLDPFPTTVDQFLGLADEATQMVYDAGARGQMTTYRWNELEPTSGVYSVDKFRELGMAMDRAQNRGLVQYLGIQLINTTARELPAGLSGLNFDDAAVKSRFRALLDRVITPYRGRIKYLSIGNEVDAYLRAHPTQWVRYQRLVEDAAQYARSLDPDLLVGVTTTFDGAVGLSPTEVQALNAASDVVILTYYPLQYDAIQGVTVRDPAVVAADFQLMLNVAGSKPLVLQEVGYPASVVNDSSQSKQAAFVSNVFAAWTDSGGRIPFLNFFPLHDFPPSTCDDFEVYYGQAGVPGFKDFLCSLGLKTVNGTARQAWSTLLAEARAAHF